MQKEAGFAEVNGTRLYYEVAGSGDPLVLIHGMTLDTRMWDDQFEPLAHQYRVVRYDARGFGKSALPTAGRPYAHTDDLKALLNHLDTARAFILGLSMGGGIAIDFAVAHPGATEALIPVDSRLNGWQPDSEFAAYLSAVRARAGEAGIQAARDAWTYSAMFKPALQNPTVASRLVQIIADYSGWHWVNDNPLRTPDPPAAQRLHTIRVPTLIVIGEQDVPDCQAIADILHQRIPNSMRSYRTSWRHNNARPNFRLERSGGAPAAQPGVGRTIGTLQRDGYETDSR